MRSFSGIIVLAICAMLFDSCRRESITPAAPPGPYTVGTFTIKADFPANSRSYEVNVASDSFGSANLTVWRLDPSQNQWQFIGEQCDWKGLDIYSDYPAFATGNAYYCFSGGGGDCYGDCLYEFVP